MWTCSDIQQRSAAYFANGLAPQESQQLEVHLSQCAACRLDLSEAYSAFRLASAAFNAPDAVGGLNAARLGAIYAAGSGTVASTSAQPARAELHRSGFAAAAGLVVALAAWMEQPATDRAQDVPLRIASIVVPAAPSATRPSGHGYPASFGLIYPADFRASGGYTPDSTDVTVLIDYDSIKDQSLFIYDPAYGMGRTVISGGSRTLEASVMSYYGLDGPKGLLRL